MHLHNQDHDIDYQEMIDLLTRIAYQEPFFGPLSRNLPESQLLKKLEGFGYIKYCPYPEECWVVLQPGEELLRLIVDSSLLRIPGSKNKH